MTEFSQIDVESVPYVYTEKTCSMDPKDIGATMAGAFQNVWEFMRTHGIETTGKVLAVYHTYDPEKMTFRAGFSVAPEAAANTAAPVAFDTTPAGQVLYFQHKGPYDTLRDSYTEMMTYLDQKGMAVGAPTWEVYLNDPAETPADELLTDVYVSLA